LPKQVVQERYERLVALVEGITAEENRALLGRTVEVLVAVGEGRKDGATGRMSGRARDGRLVHFAATTQSGNGRVRPGDVVETVVTYAAPHHLVADGPLVSHRRTRAGDCWEVGQTARTPGVMLGLPKVGPPPQPAATASGCG
jgi:tRNA-2-methylthio-N6-dimethylallyladenosine synthase